MVISAAKMESGFGISLTVICRKKQRRIGGYKTSNKDSNVSSDKQTPKIYANERDNTHFKRMNIYLMNRDDVTIDYKCIEYDKVVGKESVLVDWTNVTKETAAIWWDHDIKSGCNRVE